MLKIKFKTKSRMLSCHKPHENRTNVLITPLSVKLLVFRNCHPLVL